MAEKIDKLLQDKKTESGLIMERGSFHGDRLRTLREQMKLSREELATKADISLQTIARLELTNAVSGTDTLAKLANILKVPCGYLLGEEVLNLSEFSIPGEFQKKVAGFLEKLMATRNPSQLLEGLSIFLSSQQPDRIEGLLQTAGISEEEEVLGLWWSIVSAYQHGDWDTMIAKSQTLIDLAEGLGRPYLAALGHAYKAKAVRNKGGRDAIKKAEEELNEILRAEKFQSALTCRLISKICSRQQNDLEALQWRKKSEELMLKSNRDDALFLFEKVKLFRGIASANVELARNAKKDNIESAVSEHLAEADAYLKLCKDAISRLEKQLEREAKVERMLLAFCTARYLEVSGKAESAVKSAKEALELAAEVGQESYAVRIRMFLCHMHVEIGKKDEAIHYFGSLIPLQNYSSGRYGWQYQKYIGPHEDTLREYMEEQNVFLNQRLEKKKEAAASL